MAKLGIDSVAYLNTAAATSWTTPTWDELDIISDLTENSDWDVADVIIRRSWVKQAAKTVLDCTVTCKMLREPINPLYQKILLALRGRDTVDMLFLDASIDTIGAEGIRFIAQVTKGGGSQNTGDALYRDITFHPYPDEDPTHVPSWADVAAAGVATFTPVKPVAGGLLSLSREPLTPVSAREMARKMGMPTVDVKPSAAWSQGVELKPSPTA